VKHFAGSCGAGKGRGETYLLWESPHFGYSSALDNFWNFRLGDLLQFVTSGVMVWAVIKAPAWAVKAQWELQLKAENRQLKLKLFKTLMSTRGNAVNEHHVEALNLIDVEFDRDSQEDRGVRLAWKEYLDHLIQSTKDAETGKNEKPQVDAREERRQNLLAQLLFKIGRALGYNFEGFDFIYLKERAYVPQGHVDLATDQYQLRKGLLKMIWEGRPLMVVPLDPPAPKDASADTGAGKTEGKK
jgi:hypothetical protein